MEEPKESDNLWSLNPFASLSTRADAQRLLNWAVNYTVMATIASYATAMWLGVRYEGFDFDTIAILGFIVAIEIIIIFLLGRHGAFWSLGLLATLNFFDGIMGVHETMLVGTSLARLERLLSLAFDLIIAMNGIWIFRCVLFLLRNGGRLSIAKAPTDEGGAP